MVLGQRRYCKEAAGWGGGSGTPTVTDGGRRRTRSLGFVPHCICISLQAYLCICSAWYEGTMVDLEQDWVIVIGRINGCENLVIPYVVGYPLCRVMSHIPCYSYKSVKSKIFSIVFKIFLLIIFLAQYSEVQFVQYVYSINNKNYFQNHDMKNIIISNILFLKSTMPCKDFIFFKSLFQLAGISESLL